MADDEKRTKPKYEAPTVVALGGLAQGRGANCEAGGSANPGYCTAGTAAESSCTDVGNAALVGACTAGNTAGSACTAGGSPA